MSSEVHPAIRRYVQGEITALRAAASIGNEITVGDVIMMVKTAGLSFPLQPPAQAKKELERA